MARSMRQVSKANKRIHERDKKESNTIHAINRAEERYGIALNRHKRRSIIEQIHAENHSLIEKQSNSRSVHRVCVDGQYICVVYCKRNKSLVTILPPEYKPGDFQRKEEPTAEDLI